MNVETSATVPQGTPSLGFAADAEGVQDSNVRQFLQLWFDSRNSGQMPGKEFLDPLRLRFLLGSLSLLEVHHDPLRFRYRLVGTDIVERLGHELTNKWLDEHPDPAWRPFLLKGATMVHHAAMPIYAHVQSRTLGYDWLLEVVAVPLFGPDGEVAYIGAGQSFPPYKSERPVGQPAS